MAYLVKNYNLYISVSCDNMLMLLQRIGGPCGLTTGVVVEWCVSGLLHRIIIKVRRRLVYVPVAGLIWVTELAPHWSRLRNSMIMRIYNDVTLGLTTGHWSEQSRMNLLVPHRRASHSGTCRYQVLPSHRLHQPHKHQQTRLHTFSILIR